MKSALDGGLNLFHPRRVVGRVVPSWQTAGSPDRRQVSEVGPPQQPRGRGTLRLLGQLGNSKFYSHDAASTHPLG